MKKAALKVLVMFSMFVPMNLVAIYAQSRPLPIQKRNLDQLPGSGQLYSVQGSGPGQWSMALIGEFSVAAGSMNNHYIGLVQQGQRYRVEAIGLRDFAPVILTIEAHLVDDREPNGVIASSDTCDTGGQKACLDTRATGDGPLIVFLRGADFKEGRYRLFVSVERTPERAE